MIGWTVFYLGAAIESTIISLFVTVLRDFMIRTVLTLGYHRANG